MTAAAAPEAVALAEAPGLSPQKRAKLHRLFAQGQTRAQIAKALKVDRSVVYQAIKTAEATGTLPAVRKRMAALLENTLEDAFLAKSKAPAKLTGYEIGVLFEKWQTLEGQANQVIEVRHTGFAAAKVVSDLVDLANGTLPLAIDVGGMAPEEETK